MTRIEPERELVRRALPFAFPAFIGAFVLGWIAGGAGTAWSAGLAIAVVAANFVAFALSMAWAARISPTMIAVVAMAGYLIRLIVYTAVLVACNTFDWFSPVAFTLALIPTVIGLLVFEAKLLSGRRMQAELWSFEATDR